ncbi:MAG: hypothetical protein ACOYOE_09095 [Chlorobium sp.]
MGKKPTLARCQAKIDGDIHTLTGVREECLYFREYSAISPAVENVETIAVNIS